MESTIRQEVYGRIVFAKYLQKSAESACSNKNDRMEFTKGILLLHDAVEQMLGAVADHLHVKLKGKNIYLLEYFDLIEQHDPEKRKLSYRIQMRNLNSIRRSAKHEGIFPNIKTSSHFPGTVFALLEEACKTYFDIELQTVSLKSLIRNDKVRKYIDEAEQLIDKGDYEKALISLAFAMFYICESSTMTSPLRRLILGKKDAAEIEFTQPYKTEYKLELVEHGIDPYLYYRFCNLTPRIARHTETNDLYHWWNKYYGHPANWTKQNALFCLNFCIETALNYQRDVNEGYSLVSYMEIYEDVIEPKRETAIIYNSSKYPSKYIPHGKTLQRKPIFELKKGQSIVGIAMDDEERLDEWSIASDDLSSKSNKYGIGYVAKGEVFVERRPRGTLRE
ncbi:MAG: hypothetical protein KKB81_08405 [Candidatus Margulisbacteria bacterium]|nr:hypothetical protein [Candidatus Margulisiibacteriota bacterium]MBU1021137.1 hypothetical protein [Candidatus Margulisiibacteriota bacterium]MBU1729430.1 hypothetical protein [Candidatus Margulisiibacteriota bacterium]